LNDPINTIKKNPYQKFLVKKIKQQKNIKKKQKNKQAFLKKLNITLRDLVKVMVLAVVALV